MTTTKLANIFLSGSQFVFQRGKTLFPKWYQIKQMIQNIFDISVRFVEVLAFRVMSDDIYFIVTRSSKVIIFSRGVFVYWFVMIFHWHGGHVPFKRYEDVTIWKRFPQHWLFDAGPNKQLSKHSSSWWFEWAQFALTFVGRKRLNLTYYSNNVFITKIFTDMWWEFPRSCFYSTHITLIILRLGRHRFKKS